MQEIGSRFKHFQSKAYTRSVQRYPISSIKTRLVFHLLTIQACSKVFPNNTQGFQALVQIVALFKFKISDNKFSAIMKEVLILAYTVNTRSHQQSFKCALMNLMVVYALDVWCGVLIIVWWCCHPHLCQYINHFIMHRYFNNKIWEG